MQRVLRHILLASCLAGTSLFSACGGGGGGGGADPTLTFAITDSASDDIESFTVEVKQVTLRKLGGAVVDVLTTPATVDLATLTESSQILSVGNVPAGTYVSATIQLDFTNSTCMLLGQTTPATILDTDGNPLTGNPLTGILTLPIDFGGNRLIAPFNKHKLLEFDFDLNQSVTTDRITNTATVEPAFVLHVDPSAPKTLLAFGTFVSADTATNTFDVEIRTLGGTLLTTATFHCGTTTIWHVDGVSSQGAAGLAALAGLPAAAGTWVQLAASVDPFHPQFDVVYVEAGVGTWNGGDDIIEGHIVDRLGAAGTNPVLTVLGFSSNALHDSFLFNQSFTVSANFTNTKVLRTAIDQAFDTDDLKVGQRVRIFGSLSGFTMDATSTRSVVRMQPTRVLGFASAAPAPNGVMTIDLVRVDLRPDTVFNWTPPNPDAFAIQVGTLGTGLGIGSATPVEARGFFTAIDDATQDFVASSVTNRALAPSLMLIRNRPNGMTLTLDPNPTTIEIHISNAPTTGEFAIIDAGFVGVQDLPSSPTPTLKVPPVAGPHFYVLRDKGLNTTTLYLTFAAFAAGLDLIPPGATIDQVAAIGKYTSTTNSMEAQIAFVVIE